MKTLVTAILLSLAFILVCQSSPIIVKDSRGRVKYVLHTYNGSTTVKNASGRVVGTVKKSNNNQFRVYNSRGIYQGAYQTKDSIRYKRY